LGLFGYSRRVVENAMSKAIAIFGSALFFVIVPLMLAAFVPWWMT
jgi:phosphoenolpyruvate carboxylase